ncbi:hypothetical protein GQ597_04085 [Gilliamella sp. Pra-s65]|nr:MULTISPECIES: hypothetical protein [unclassified Gilliamella]MWN89891.1 hypothetical protein [Gilliamella sp. Pra-s65]MWP73063.1 hypothetical protein [Gilliamella sp. Pra-s52]
MSHAIYLSPKSANQSALIYIKINRHNPKGYIEKSNGQVIKLHKKLIAD